MRVTFLGTGTSHGVPAIGCRCQTCLSDDPRDRRWRPSILIELSAGVTVLVDAAPDLRSQALAFGLSRLDAIFLTHAHADHLLGLDDVRRFNELQGGPISCYADRQTLAELRHTFAYAFRPGPVGGGIPRLNLFTIAGTFSLGRLEVVPVPVMHGAQSILGFRVGRFAYLTDCSGIPDASWPLLGGVEVLALDALRLRPHPTHFTLGQALDVVRRLQPDRAYLTHIAHDIRHADLAARLPPGVFLSHDGLNVMIEGKRP